MIGCKFVDLNSKDCKLQLEFRDMSTDCLYFFILVIPCIVNIFYVSNQPDAVLSSLFILLQSIHSSDCYLTLAWSK